MNERRDAGKKRAIDHCSSDLGLVGLVGMVASFPYHGPHSRVSIHFHHMSDDGWKIFSMEIIIGDIGHQKSLEMSLQASTRRKDGTGCTEQATAVRTRSPRKQTDQKIKRIENYLVQNSRSLGQRNKLWCMDCEDGRNCSIPIPTITGRRPCGDISGL